MTLFRVVIVHGVCRDFRGNILREHADILGPQRRRPIVSIGARAFFFQIALSVAVERLAPSK
jgi:hypothetical protein